VIEPWTFLPERVRELAQRAQEASKGAHWRRGDVSDYSPFAGAWELAAGTISLARSLPLIEARELVLALWAEIGRLEGDRREVERARERERQELYDRIDALNQHIDSLGGP
jgi:hypothetical protein